MGQLSFFSAEARHPCVADLAGLLCGPGRAAGFARGRAARIAVPLDERWRGSALVTALGERGVQARVALVPSPPVVEAVEDAEDVEPVEVEPSPDLWEIATPFRKDLVGLAAQWGEGGAKRVPADFTAHGGVLRMWALASGRWAESGYVLGLDPTAPDTHEPLQKALASSGLPATLLKSGGPALRVVGRRRLERLAELVGRAPRGVGERTWPAA